MERQLRMGGGIMNLEPRQQYGLGSFVKKAVKGVTGAVKGVAGGIKDFVKSDAGKLALLAGGVYGLNKWFRINSTWIFRKTAWNNWKSYRIRIRKRRPIR